jgi:RNA polymerase sigma-70 factor (ECF subfamily)
VSSFGYAGSPHRRVLDARVALRRGLTALRNELMHTMPMRGDPHPPRTQGGRHANDQPSRHQPRGNAKPMAGKSTGRPGGPIPEQPGGGPEGREPPATGEIVASAPTGESGPRLPDQRHPADRATEVRALVERAQAGEAEAFGLIYDRYVDAVFRFVYFRVGKQQLAEDLTSDTFLRALRSIGSFTWQGRDLGAWLVTIARNLITDYYKSGRYRFEVSTADLLDPDAGDRGGGASPETAVVDHLTNVALLTAVKRLSPEQRECIVLRFLQGLSVAETAVAMGKNEGAIKALQYRAVRALARLLPDGFAW